MAQNYRENDIPDAVEIRERKRITFFALPFSFTTYTLNAAKLIIKQGLLTSVEDEILLYRIMDVTLRRTLGQKIFGLGTIIVASSDKTSPHLEIKNIKNYREFKNELDQRVAKERIRMRTRTSEMMGMDFDQDIDDDNFINM